jgi:ankyrin repeat protein
VRLLLRRGASVDLADHEGQTPLMLGCIRGTSRAVRALLESGANPCARSPDGFTPLLAAASWGVS